MSVLVMVTANGFYPIEAVSFITLEQQARDHGILNDHVLRVENETGIVLWERNNEVRH